MDQALIEYLGRYTEHVFVSDHNYIVVGKPLEKSIKVGCRCGSGIIDTMEIVDIIDKFDVYNPDKKEYTSAYGKIGNIVEKKAHYYENYVDSFYSGIYFAIYDMDDDGIKMRWYWGMSNCYPANGYILMKKIPKRVKIIIFSKYFNKPVSNIPETVKEIRFGNSYNQPGNNFHNGITSIRFGSDFDQDVDNLPKSLRRLQFGFNFNKPVDNLPNNIITIRFGHKFNHAVDNLPKKLETVFFGGQFRHQIDKLPKTVKKIVLRENFNQPIDHLPDGLTHLTLGTYFNHPIDKLPKSLKYLNTGYEFNRSIDNLPCGLVRLELGKNFNKPIDKLPKRLKRIELRGPYDFSKENHRINNGVEIVQLNSDYLYDLSYIPASVTKMIFGFVYTKQIINLPITVKTIIIHRRNYAHVLDHIPKTTKIIKK